MFAQGDYENGYVVQNNGDTLFGQILFNDKMIFESCFFKTKTNENPVIFKPFDIRSFRLTNNLIKSIRLKKAYKLIHDSGLRISEAAYQSGFSDPKYFTTCFKKEFGVNPSQIVSD